MRQITLVLLLSACSPAETALGGATDSSPGSSGSSSGGDETTMVLDLPSPDTISPDEWVAPGKCSVPGMTQSDLIWVNQEWVPDPDRLVLLGECPPCPPDVGYSACTENGTCGCVWEAKVSLGTPQEDEKHVCDWGMSLLITNPKCGPNWPNTDGNASAYPVSDPYDCPNVREDPPGWWGVDGVICEAQREGWTDWLLCDYRGEGNVYEENHPDWPVGSCYGGTLGPP